MAQEQADQRKKWEQSPMKAVLLFARMWCLQAVALWGRPVAGDSTA